MILERKFLYYLIITVCFSIFFFEQSYAKAIAQQWQQIPLRTKAQKIAGVKGGEGCQMVFDIAYAPANPDIVYFVTDTSRVWKSMDGGNSWQMKYRGFKSNGGLSIGIDPLNEDVVFVAGFLGRRDTSSSADGIYRSLNGGESWELVKQTAYFRDKEGSHFVFSPASSERSHTKVIYAGTHRDGLLISVDGGTTWKRIGFKRERIIDLELIKKKPVTLLVAANTGLFYFDTKNKIKTRLSAKGLISTPKTIAVNPTTNPPIIFAAVGKQGVYKSTDNGETFWPINNGLPSDIEYVQINISKKDPDYLYVAANKWGGLNPFRSHDGGETWFKPLTLDKENLALTSGRFSSCPIAIHPTKPEIAITSTNGASKIIKTMNGGKSWSYSANGFTGARAGVGRTSFGFSDDPQKLVIFLIDFGPALSNNGGDTFRLLPVHRVFKSKTTPAGAIDPTGNSKVIVTAVGKWGKQLLTVSKDGGETWTVIAGTEDNYKFISFHPQKPNIIYARRWKSIDKGKSWRMLSQGIRAVYHGNGDIVFSVKGLGRGGSVILKSFDAGKTWISPFEKLPVNSRGINEIAIDPLDHNRIYIASNSGLYILHGQRWLRKREKSGLEKDGFGLFSVKCVAIDPGHPGVVYIGRWAPGKGNSNGVFRSTDFGETWTNITYNLGPEITVWSLSVSPHDGKVYLGSSYGTWVLSPPYI